MVIYHFPFYLLDIQGGDKMAIQATKEKLTLRLELDGGMVDGKRKVNSKSFTQIKTSAEDQALFNTASVIAALQEKDLLNVKRVEITSISEE